jgi:hypothetical protein
MIKHLSLIASIVAVLAMAGTAQAHYVYTFSGWIYHSIGCGITVKQVPNQEKFPGQAKCEVFPANSVVTVWCANPAGYVFAGHAAVSSFTGTSTFTPAGGGFTKDGGTASATVDLVPTLADYIGACPNNNWSVVAVVVESFETFITIYDYSNNIATIVHAQCTLPPGVLGTIPPANTAYSCGTPTAQHVS